MGATPLMFATASWSVPYVKKLLERKADVLLEDRDGRTVLDVASEAILIWEDKKDAESKSCRKRRLEMEITGCLAWDRANVEELDPYTDMPKLYEIKALLAKAGAKPGTRVKLIGYD